MINKICVFCGSAHGSTTVYAEMAAALGKVLAERQIELIYGGAAVGTMGVIADTVLAAGGRVTGIIPKHLHSEVAHDNLTEIRVVDSMHTRKAMMLEMADAIIALPGGFGTLDEIFEALSWRQLGLHRKPCGILNVNGYYDQLIAFLDHAVAAGFIRQEHRDILQVAKSPEALLEMLDKYCHREISKWY
jgi:uncharacterized protein (TIGR00730 family)